MSVEEATVLYKLCSREGYFLGVQTKSFGLERIEVDMNTYVGVGALGK